MSDVETAPAPAAGAETPESIWNELSAAETTPADAGGADAGKASGADASTDTPADATTTATAPGADASGKATDAAASVTAPTTADDPWAAAPPELKAKWEESQHELRSNRGRLAAQTRKINALMAGQKTDAAPTTGAARTDAPADGNALFEDEGWKKFEGEYGDVAAPIKKVIGSVVAENANLKRELSTHTAARSEDHYADQAKFVIDTHDDYLTAIKSKEFQSWFDSAPAYIQAGVRRNGQKIIDGQEVADLITRFKTDTGYGRAAATTASAAAASTATAPATTALSDKRKQQLESAAAPRTNGPAKVSTEIPEDGDPEVIWKALEARGL